MGEAQQGMVEEVEERDQLGEAAVEPGTLRLGHASYLCDLRHDVDQSAVATVPAPEPGVVSRWRMKDRVSVIPRCPCSKWAHCRLCWVSCKLDRERNPRSGSGMDWMGDQCLKL
jgi:hypothetical protein